MGNAYWASVGAGIGGTLISGALALYSDKLPFLIALVITIIYIIFMYAIMITIESKK